MTGILRYVPGNTVFHRLDARTKLILPVLVCAAAALAKGYLALLMILAVDFLIGVLSGQARRTLGLFFTLLKVSTFLFVLQLLFVRAGTPVFTLGITVTDAGLHSAAQVVLRLIGATMPLAMFLAITRMSEITTALVAKWHVPYKYAFAVTSAIRFVPTFMLDMRDIIEAQTARGVEMDTRNPFRKMALVLPLCAPLLISSVKRIDAVALAAEMRGFNLRPRSAGGEHMKLRAADCAMLAAGVLVVAGGLLL